MRLSSVSVKGLFGCFDHDFEIGDEGVLFLYSQNGVGKSTILKMMADLLNGRGDKLADVPFGSIDIRFRNGTVISAAKVDGLSFSVTENGEERKVSSDDIKGYCPTIYLSPERNIATMRDGTLVHSIDLVADGFRRRMNEAKDYIPSAAVPEYPGDGEALINRCRDLKSRIDFISETGLFYSLPKDLPFPPARSDLEDSKERYLELISSVADWTERNYGLAESASAFRDIVNGMLTNKRIVMDGDFSLSVELTNGLRLPLNKLSAGEKQIIIILYRLLFHASEESLAIVDEPEISLHILWQHRLSDLFLEMNRIRDIQLIIATHSPQIIHDKWDLATELRV